MRTRQRIDGKMYDHEGYAVTRTRAEYTARALKRIHSNVRVIEGKDHKGEKVWHIWSRK